ncbi:MAG: hypothetical protein VKO39_08185 [Cyanobacteriota bacterium]|nr:hypothetical protein [Cyanobacteriota bacterium]
MLRRDRSRRDQEAGAQVAGDRLRVPSHFRPTSQCRCGATGDGDPAGNGDAASPGEPSPDHPCAGDPRSGDPTPGEPSLGELTELTPGEASPGGSDRA